MGMNTYVEGIKPADEKFKKMLDIYNACDVAGVQIPEEVNRFFNGETPDEAGVKEYLSVSKTPYLSEYFADMQEGIEVRVDEIPDDIKIIRFINSW